MRAFTRIELLVVIAIVAMSCSVIGAALQSAREAARRNQVRSNLHVLAIVIRDFGPVSENELSQLAGMKPPKTGVDDTDTKLFFTVIAIFATVGTVLGALLIGCVVRYLNRGDNRGIEGMHEVLAATFILDRWFCPPSSSPL